MRKSILSLIVLANVALSSQAFSASITDFSEYIGKTGLLTVINNGALDKETYRSECVVVNNNGNLEINADLEILLSADLENAKKNVYRDTETATVYTVTSFLGTGEFAQSSCRSSAVESRLQEVVVTDTSVSIQESVVCTNGQKVKASQTCSIKL